MNWISCEPCGKRAYDSRATARAVAKTIPGDHMTAYRCPTGNGYHLGHLPRSVVHGLSSKADYVERLERRRQEAAS